MVQSGLAWWLSVLGCGSPAPSTPEAPAPEPAAKVETGPQRVLFMVQAQFLPTNKPGPAKGVFYRQVSGRWEAETLEDPESNVWHKAVFWRDGVLTIGAQKALLKHWTRDAAGEWTAETLYEATFGGRFDRFRDVEIGDVDGDGQDEIVLATHDAGVVAVGDEADGAWTFQQFDKAPDTFVHEVEIGDVDGDGRQEFYVTPSERNRASGASQPGGVYRYDHKPDGTYARRPVVQYDDTHAKEILVTDLDGDGTDELYVVKEGVTKAAAAKTTLEAPVTIERYTAADGAFTKTEVGSLAAESQCRFLVAGDVDHDGQNELVAAAKSTGLWMLDPSGDGFTTTNIAEDTGGFEHATHLADLDGDGKLEIYAASELRTHRLLRRYTFDGGEFRAQVMAPIPERHITWNLADGTL